MLRRCLRSIRTSDGSTAEISETPPGARRPFLFATDTRPGWRASAPARHEVEVYLTGVAELITEGEFFWTGA